MSGFRFYLGVHHADWLEELSVPMCASHHILADRRTLPRASAPWICDSGAYSHLDKYGAWRIRPEQYVAAVRRYRDEVGRLQWAAYAYLDTVHGCADDDRLRPEGPSCCTWRRLRD